MDVANSNTRDGVIAVLVKTLGIEERADQLTSSTALLGNLPELDSRAVIELVLALEETFGFEFDDDDFSGDIFETVETLAVFVEQQLA